MIFYPSNKAMTSTYIKSLSNNLGGSLSPDQLQTTINADPAIGAECLAIINKGDDVKFIFDASLSGGELGTLDTLMSNHVPVVQTQRTVLASLVPPKYKFSSAYYMRVVTFVYGGTNELPGLTNIAIASYQGPNVTDYTIRCIDVGNDSVTMAEATFSNTDEAVNDISIVTQLPSGPSTLEFQVKVNGTTNGWVYIENIVLTNE